MLKSHDLSKSLGQILNDQKKITRQNTQEIQELESEKIEIGEDDIIQKHEARMKKQADAKAKAEKEAIAQIT